MTYAELREAIDDEIEEMNRFLDCPETYGGDFEENADQIDLDIEVASQLRDEAEDLAAVGLIAAAERRLECFLFPKWLSIENCEDDYREAMNR